jgi:hypothetical protein
MLWLSGRANASTKEEGRRQLSPHFLFTATVKIHLVYNTYRIRHVFHAQKERY